MATDLDACKKERSVIRRLFTKTANEFEAGLEADVSLQQTHTTFLKMSELTENLNKLDETIKRLIMINLDEEQLEKEIENVYEYKTRWLSISAMFKELKQASLTETSESSCDNKKIRNLKLPKLQLQVFDGELKGWLPFWGQFSKIHSDSTLDDTEKFQYLLQSMKDGSDAKRLIETFPPTAYKDCVEQLQSRYAREDLLIQIYIREILTLVLMKNQDDDITKLYDQLNAQLRALETLKVTKEKYAAFLLPMVESALPQEILRIWERNRIIGKDAAEDLNNLLEFLRKEVESEQRLEMARKTFKNVERPVTAECLISNVKTKQKQPKEIKNLCIWCDKDTHASVECYKVNKMNLEERKSMLKQKKGCPICLRKGHHPKICRASVKCLICTKRHSTILCPDQNMEEPKKDISNSLSSMNLGETLLQTVIVTIQYKEDKQQVRALLDSGSQRTYIKQNIVERLKIPPTGKEQLTHILFGGVETNAKEFTVYDINIKSLNNSFTMNMSAISQNNICGIIPKTNCNDKDLEHFLNVNSITLTDKDSNIKEIGLLIGADYLGFLLTGSVIQVKNGLVAVKTKLGWTLQGKQVSGNVSNNHTTVFHCTCDNVLTEYWSLESLGIRDPTEVKSKAEVEAETMIAFEENIKITEKNRYEIKLPFKTSKDDLLPNFYIAKQRLESMSKKLVQTGRFNEYNSVFNTWLDLGVIEIINNDDIVGHYLPHRPVFKDQSLTSTIRPVFDASTKDKNGLSLNACLEKGNNLIDLIPNLINNFRTGAVGITSDIEKAFLQISVTKNDRDYLKFLWYKDDTLQDLITYRHCRVVFGLTSSPFLLSATLHHHLNKMANGPLSVTAKLLNRSFYVDNCVVSVDTKKEADKFINEAKTLMNAANFNLRMWVTSEDTNETGKETITVLGLNWDTIRDELYCNCTTLPSVENLKNLTKRQLLSITQKIFDPIGYTSPAMLTPKLILQETWRRQISWDDELPADLLAELLTWYKYIPYLKDCRVPRRLTVDTLKETEVSLHLFVDASKDGCGACVLLRAERSGNTTVQMVAAKSRVAPTEKVTIPRLELTAALIGSRLLANVRENLKLLDNKEYCWTDSGVTLSWIKRELPLKTFVGNRIKEIRQNTNISNWHHIPGEDNWADIASRGCNAKTLYNIRWFEGPAWLRLPPSCWPRSELLVDEHQVILETKKIVSNAVSSTTTLLDKLQSYFSKYTKIVRMTAWMLRFVYNTKHVNNKKVGEITYNEYEKSEKVIIKLIQKESREFIEKKLGNLLKFTDKDGIIRVKTKLLLSDFPESVQTPYLLPAKNRIVKLMVRHRHMQLQHAGNNQLIADIRMRFWIVGIRRLVRSVTSSCTICARYRSKPTLAPTAPLPPERVICSAPFQSTGVDLAGPLLLRDGEKCWIVLYTCAVYRAVHLELTKSLSTEAFIMTLRRFTARRGRVSMIMSDRGTNFHGTKNLLNMLDWDEIQKQSTVRRITWKMNAPSAAWWGGYWERLIRIMKDLLRRILGKASVSYDELQTIICDCEATMNGRPLTYINNDKNEYLEPLTPAYFVQPIPNSDVTDLDQIDTKSLNSRLRYLQTLRDQFRSRFKSEYLTFLVQKGNEKKDSIGTGDIVLVETEEKRIRWPLGIVKEMFIGRDGVVRTAKVKTSTGVKIRPVQRLYKLEITGNDFTLLQTHEPPEDLVNIGVQPHATTTQDDESMDSIMLPDIVGKAPKFSRGGRNIKLPSKFDLYHL